MLMVDEHIKLLAAQYLASALRETHCMFDTVTSPQGPRNLKETLQSAFYKDVVPYLNDDGVIPRAHYNDVKNKIPKDFAR